MAISSGGGGDDEAIGRSDTIGGATLAEGEVAKRPVVHVQGAGPEDVGRSISSRARPVLGLNWSPSLRAVEQAGIQGGSRPGCGRR